MKTLMAVVAGLVVTGVLVFCGDAAISAATGTWVVIGYPGPSYAIELAALAWTAVALITGALVAVRIQPGPQTITGFTLAELFFGAGLLHEFWHTQTMFNLLALLIVIPAAMIGNRLALWTRHPRPSVS